MKFLQKIRTCGERSFAVAAPFLWNSLSDHIENSGSEAAINSRLVQRDAMSNLVKAPLNRQKVLQLLRNIISLVFFRFSYIFFLLFVIITLVVSTLPLLLVKCIYHKDFT